MLDIKDFVGQGQYGDVLDGLLIGFRGKATTPCVIVTLRPNASQTDKARFTEEANRSGMLDHKHVTRFLAMAVGSNPPGVRCFIYVWVTPFAETHVGLVEGGIESHVRLAWHRLSTLHPPIISLGTSS
jgi:hypothetical protein